MLKAKLIMVVRTVYEESPRQSFNSTENYKILIFILFYFIFLLRSTSTSQTRVAYIEYCYKKYPKVCVDCRGQGSVVVDELRRLESSGK